MLKIQFINKQQWRLNVKHLLKKAPLQQRRPRMTTNATYVTRPSVKSIWPVT